VRPDINVAISKLSQNLKNPEPEHAKHLLHLLQYLHTTRNKTLDLNPSKRTGLEIYSDSNFADASDKRRRSTSGTIITLHGRPIAWKSKLQTCTADSTHEAELYAMHQSLKLGLSLRYSLNDLGLIANAPAPMYVDNAACQCTAHLYDQITSRNRHIPTRYFKICDHTESGEIIVKWKSGKCNPADLFTKPLSATESAPHLDFIFHGTAYPLQVVGGCLAVNPPSPHRVRISAPDLIEP